MSYFQRFKRTDTSGKALILASALLGILMIWFAGSIAFEAEKADGLVEIIQVVVFPVLLLAQAILAFRIADSVIRDPF